MSEQVPQPEPTPEQPSHQSIEVSKVGKTPDEIAEQVGRMTSKLLERNSRIKEKQQDATPGQFHSDTVDLPSTHQMNSGEKAEEGKIIASQNNSKATDFNTRIIDKNRSGTDRTTITTENRNGSPLEVTRTEVLPGIGPIETPVSNIDEQVTASAEALNKLRAETSTRKAVVDAQVTAKVA